MKNNAQNLKILKAIENQALQAKQARESQVCKTRITKALFEANKAKTSDKTRTFRAEIEDLKNVIKNVDVDVAEIQVNKLFIPQS